MKRCLALFLVLMLGLSLTSIGAIAEDSYSVGVCFPDITNPIFAECTDLFTKMGAERGWDVTVLESQQVAATEIAQIENLIEKKVDAIVVYPIDVAALNDVCQRAVDAGIKLMSWDLELECANTAYLVKNYDVGYAIGTASAKWINEHYPEGCEVAVLDYAMIPVIVERANGILAALADLAPQAKVVAQDSGALVAQAMTTVETMLQAHPDIKVFSCIGDGGGIGANEVLKASGVNLDDYGIFCCDASDEALAAIANNEAIRTTISLGTPTDFVNTVFDAIATMMTQTGYEKEIYKVSTPVTAENLSEFYKPAN